MSNTRMLFKMEWQKFNVQEDPWTIELDDRLVEYKLGGKFRSA
jgi:hypothetical protein